MKLKLSFDRWFLIFVFTLITSIQSYAATEITTKIKGKDCPIVLVHGFLGWGRDEMAGYLYWGGNALDIEKHLAKKGFQVFTASVGPISSVHDRACELFWQLKGGCVDYGAEHAKKFGHKRFGRKYSAMLPQWDEAHPIHMIGHSMGGQTIRYLAELLAQDFFNQGTNERWILSVSTISTPHNGTTLATIVGNIFWNTFDEILSGLVALSGGTLDSVYDFDLIQWGIERKRKESISSHLARIVTAIGNTHDIASWDLSPQGARELNEKIRVFPDLYYMSYANSKTFKTWLSQVDLAKLSMNPALLFPADFMGTYRGEAIPADKTNLWHINDGIVNTISMAGPSNSPIVKYRSGPIKKGIWTCIGHASDKDHLQIVGHYVDSSWIVNFYNNIAKRLATLDR
ncbi:MAG: lipase [Candidatus Riflebacteria bacterium]|nr:lipase [Candidatus Riflebacteria bacterium]